ncbi:E3 ubiquitin-protein ligase UBR3, partial [Camelus dromedarius]
HFTCIVKVLFTLLYTQALVAVSVKCNEEDRLAQLLGLLNPWKNTYKTSAYLSSESPAFFSTTFLGKIYLAARPCLSKSQDGNYHTYYSCLRIITPSSSTTTEKPVVSAPRFLKILPFALFVHSQNCGAGTGIFLLINASVIIIIRGHRFCLWGSVYLDAHGEEDRDLRRGKPLYICKERYKVLEQQWISHTFDHINKRWGPHYNGL